MPQNPQQFWERHARRYDRVTLMLNRRFAAMAAEVAADVRGSARVLEVAAGTGLVTAVLAPAVTTLVATDRSAEMLKVLEGRTTAARLTNVTTEQVDAMSLPFAAGAFDAAVAANLLHLLPDPGGALDELHRVLGVGGVLCVPTFEHGASALAHVTSRVLALAGFPVVTRFRGDMLRSLVERHGSS